jgi:TolB-like protein
LLRLTIFGRFCARDALGNEVPIKSKKSRALLAYLALPLGKERSREVIATLLWSDRGEEQARSSLRQALSGLRKELGEERISALRISDEALSLDPAGVIVEPAAPGDILLEGLHISDPAFEEWLRDERLRHEDAAVLDPQPLAPSLPDKPSIAVLPFKNKSGDPEQDYFSDGLTEDIITELSRFREFIVMSENATFQYKGQSINTQCIGRELGARYVVEGSVRRSGKRIRVTAQLIEAETGAQVWAEKYDRDLEDVFAIQDDLTSAVVARLEDRIKGARVTALRERPTTNMTAYDLVLQSRPYRTQATPESSRKAAKLLRQAVLADPNCAQAHAGLAFVLAGDYEEGWADNHEATLREAALAAQRAVSLDGTDGYPHASLAYVNHLTGEFDRALYEARLALDLNPNHVNIIMTMGWISIVLGDPEAGIGYIERARQLNPNMPGFALWTLGEAYLAARRYHEAVDTLMKVPNPATSLHLELAISHAYLGNLEEARVNLQKYLDLSRRELSVFPDKDPSAWRALLERSTPRKRREDVEHFIEGARKAGLPL